MSARHETASATPSKRDQLIATAIELFSAHGFHGVGIDRIAEVAQVSKKTMYHHFRSKEELIVAALRDHEERFRHTFMEAVEASADSARDRLLAVFDVAHAWFTSNTFYGCMFINAVGEYSEPDTDIRRVCKEFKHLMLSYIERLCNEAGIVTARETAAAISILLEGSIVTAQVSEDPGAAKTARSAAQVLIDSAMRRP